MLLTVRNDLDQIIVPEPAALVTALVGTALAGGWSLHARRRKNAGRRAR